MPDNVNLNDVKDWFHTELCARDIICPFRWYFHEEPTLVQSPYHFAYMKPLLISSDFQVAADKRKYIAEKMAFSFDVICEIAEATVMQFQNIDFCELHILRLTASNFGKVIDAVSRNSFCATLFADILTNKNLDSVGFDSPQYNLMKVE